MFGVWGVRRTIAKGILNIPGMVVDLKEFWEVSLVIWLQLKGFLFRLFRLKTPPGEDSNEFHIGRIQIILLVFLAEKRTAGGDPVNLFENLRGFLQQLGDIRRGAGFGKGPRNNQAGN